MGAAEHQTSDPLGPSERQFLRDHATHRHAEHVGALDRQPVEQGDGVAGQLPRGVGAGRDRRAAAAAVVVGDHAM